MGVKPISMGTTSTREEFRAGARTRLRSTSSPHGRHHTSFFLSTSFLIRWIRRSRRWRWRWRNGVRTSPRPMQGKRGGRRHDTIDAGLGHTVLSLLVVIVSWRVFFSMQRVRWVVAMAMRMMMGMKTMPMGHRGWTERYQHTRGGWLARDVSSSNERKPLQLLHLLDVVLFVHTSLGILFPCPRWIGVTSRTGIGFCSVFGQGFLHLRCRGRGRGFLSWTWPMWRTGRGGRGENRRGRGVREA